MDKKGKVTIDLNSSLRPTDQVIFQQPSIRIIQNFLLVWLDENINEINAIDQSSIVAKVHRMIDSIYTFSDVDQCIEFVTDMDQEKILMIISKPLSESIIPLIHQISQISSIYVFSESNVGHIRCAKQYVKVKGIFTDITFLCKALKQATFEHDRNSLSMSFVAPDTVTSNQSLDQLDQSFMYTQILKEILLTIDFEQEHIQSFITYCREQFLGNKFQLENIDKFKREYRDHGPIWWYTHEIFLYSMLNRALRSMEVDIIINMGFFLRDLHEHIVQLHSEQYSSNHHSSTFIVYRGQGLASKDFDQLLKTRGGLMSFNNLLSTSRNQAISLAFAESNGINPELVGVLFQITIHPSKSSTAFANIHDLSHYEDQEEILFSMHSIFRIELINSLNNTNRLWQVNLTLTNDTDQELHLLTEYVRKETFPGEKGWHRLGQLLIKIGQYNKAEQIYKTLLIHTTDDLEKVKIYHHLVLVHNRQGHYTDAIEFFHKSNEIFQSTFPINHSILASSYCNIGSVYENMGDYSKALSYYEQDLTITQNIFAPNHCNLAISYNNIGLLYDKMGDYSKALAYHEKALEIRQKCLPSNHPDLMQSYSNIGRVYFNMGQYSQAICYYEKALEIRQKTLPLDHPHLTISYDNVGLAYKHMGQYLKALSYSEKALEIRQKCLPSNHPDVASSYNNIGSIYANMGDYSKALSYYEKDLVIVQNSLPPNHPDVATSFNNMGSLCDKMGDYSKALSYHEKALEIYQKVLPLNRHPDLVVSYNNIGGVYFEMGEYSKAISYYEKALDIAQITLASNHSNLATSYNNIGVAYSKVGNYCKALSSYEKAFEILQSSLPPNHLDLASCYSNIGELYFQIGDYSKALSTYEKACQIYQQTLSPNHPKLALLYKNITYVYLKMGDYSKALSNYEKGFEIWQKTLPSNHPDVENVRKYVELLKKRL